MVSRSPRFEYGRHETFPVRFGWLGKGLWCLMREGYFRADIDVADRLGLGVKMVKSLQFWLEATGIAQAVPSHSVKTINGSPTIGSSRRRVWCITNFGSALGRLDPHLEYPITWWFLHMALARRNHSVWGWFFNYFHERQFSRLSCVGAFRGHTLESASNPPSVKMAQRDVGCLLQAYASPRGSVPDPEDSTASPLRELGLVIAHQDSGLFERTRPLDPVPVEAFLVCASNIAEGRRVPLSKLMSSCNGPARVFGIGRSQIEQLAEAASERYGPDVQIDLLGSERTLLIPEHHPEHWLKSHFDDLRSLGTAN